MKPSEGEGGFEALEGGLKRASRGFQRGLEGGFTFGRLQGGLKGDQGVHGGLKPSTLKGASSDCFGTILHMSKPVM